VAPGDGRITSRRTVAREAQVAGTSQHRLPPSVWSLVMSKTKVLVAEDELDIRNLIAFSLEYIGYKVRKQWSRRLRSNRI